MLETDYSKIVSMIRKVTESNCSKTEKLSTLLILEQNLESAIEDIISGRVITNGQSKSY